MDVKEILTKTGNGLVEGLTTGKDMIDVGILELELLKLKSNINQMQQANKKVSCKGRKGSETITNYIEAQERRIRALERYIRQITSVLQTTEAVKENFKRVDNGNQ